MLTYAATYSGGRGGTVQLFHKIGVLSSGLEVKYGLSFVKAPFQMTSNYRSDQSVQIYFSTAADLKFAFKTELLFSK